MNAPEMIRINEVEYVRKDSLTVGQPVDGCPFVPGMSYFFRTVTYHITGRVLNVVGNFLTLEKAAWIADSGRFSNAIVKGELSEVEPVGLAIISLSAITDAFPWVHELPVTQK